MRGGIALAGVHKTYPGGHPAVRGVDLEVGQGELVVLVGPSGCGKSTLLRLIAGLESPSAGEIRVAGRDVTHLGPSERDVAMVFQGYALYPHKSVRENLAFSLRVRRTPALEIDARIASVARMLDLEAILSRRPAQLSGGQRQRVALGRALVRQPQAFLLDEPLSNLDARLRSATRGALARLHRSLGATMLHVTHDQEEAMTLAERLAVMKDGRIEQVAPPAEIYARPATAFVADFVGTPAINWLTARVESRDRGLQLVGRGWSVPAPPGFAPPAAPGATSPELRVGVRPHDLVAGTSGGGNLEACIDLVERSGPTVVLHLQTAAGDALRWVLPGDVSAQPSECVALRLPREKLHLFDADGVRLA
jgi:multiple sugar transport system ATP-binding protein